MAPQTDLFRAILITNSKTHGLPRRTFPLLLPFSFEEEWELWCSWLGSLDYELKGIAVPTVVWKKSVEVFADDIRAALWLTRPNKVFGEETPQVHAIQNPGEVLDVLGGIEYGIVG